MIFTIGHSTRKLEELVNLLKTNNVRLLVDVRTIPRSRHNPQFNKDELASSMPKSGICYLHFPRLGGLRHPRKDSTNTAWRNAGFRGYADYMETAEFETALTELIDMSKKDTLAMMCAEAVYWRCHRSLLSDALLVRGIDVRHILSATKVEPHRLTSFAKVDGFHLSYPPDQPELDL